jgi:hypothetical protein
MRQRMPNIASQAYATTLSDPNTGTQFQVFSGPKSNYYTNGNGVNINSNIPPGPGFHQVNQVPQ